MKIRHFWCVRGQRSVFIKNKVLIEQVLGSLSCVSTTFRDGTLVILVFCVYVGGAIEHIDTVFKGISEHCAKLGEFCSMLMG